MPSFLSLLCRVSSNCQWLFFPMIAHILVFLSCSYWGWQKCQPTSQAENPFSISQVRQRSVFSCSQMETNMIILILGSNSGGILLPSLFCIFPFSASDEATCGFQVIEPAFSLLFKNWKQSQTFKEDGRPVWRIFLLNPFKSLFPVTLKYYGQHLLQWDIFLHKENMTNADRTFLLSDRHTSSYANCVNNVPKARIVYHSELRCHAQVSFRLGHSWLLST